MERDDLYRLGRKIRKEAFGEQGERSFAELEKIDAGHARAIAEYCFGTVWARPGLDLKTCELIVITAAVAQDLAEEVVLHVRGALNRGAARGEVIEAIVQCAPYIGFPKTNHALRAAQQAFDEFDGVRPSQA